MILSTNWYGLLGLTTLGPISRHCSLVLFSSGIICFLAISDSFILTNFLYILFIISSFSRYSYHPIQYLTYPLLLLSFLFLLFPYMVSPKSNLLLSFIISFIPHLLGFSSLLLLLFYQPIILSLLLVMCVQELHVCLWCLPALWAFVFLYHSSLLLSKIKGIVELQDLFHTLCCNLIASSHLGTLR